MMIYLAGNMSSYFYSGMPELANNWRQKAESILSLSGFSVFDPTHSAPMKFREENERSINKDIVAYNQFYLSKCDIVLVNLEDLTESIGTVFELTYAYLKGMPIVSFNRCKKPNSAHLDIMITRQSETLEDAIDYLLLWYSQGAGHVYH